MPAYEQYSKTGVDANSGVYTKFLNCFLNTRPGKGQQRFIWYLASKDKNSFSQSAKVVSGWDIEKIIPCHGDVIEEDGGAVFKRLFAWHL